MEIALDCDYYNLEKCKSGNVNLFLSLDVSNKGVFDKLVIHIDD